MIRILIFSLLILCMVSPAVAQTQGSITCSQDPQFDPPSDLLVSGDGILSYVKGEVERALNISMFALYETFVNSTLFYEIVPIALTLFVMVYGILFTFGIVQFTIFDFLVRIIKMGLIAGFLTVPFWYVDVFIYLFYFFNQGTEELIGRVIGIIIGHLPGTTPSYPFELLDIVLMKIVSARMVVTLFAMIFTGPYGLIFAILLLLSAGSFMKALFTAVWVYLMAMVLRTIMIALAPIFLICLLFERTRHLFNGWLSQLLTACLQPIFLFIFFAFFVSLISISVDGIFSTPVCWTAMPEGWRGMTDNPYFWRFAVWDGNRWVPFNGEWGWDGADGGGYGQFPIDIMNILIFLLLTQLAARFNEVVLMVAKDLAGAGTNLATMQSPFSGWFSPSTSPRNTLAGTVNRTGPGGQPYAGPNAARAREETVGNFVKDPAGAIRNLLIGNRE